MKYGWLVVSAYLKSDKFDEIYDYLVKAAKKQDCHLEIITNEEVLVDIENLLMRNPQFAIFWDKDIRAARLLEEAGINVYNSSRAIEVCDDKSLTYLELLKANIKMPRTIISPLDYGISGSAESFLGNAISRMEYPFIIKENCGSFGAQVYLVNNMEEAKAVLKKINGRGYVIQEFVSSSRGRDVRIHIVGNAYVTSMLRENDSDFRANVTNGGKMKVYTPTREQIEMAIKVCQTLKLDFAGVDIMFGDDGEPIFCEVNSNAHFKNIFDCTGVNVAEYIISYVLKRQKINGRIIGN